ncbi:thioredoxin domain-containing protein [Terrimonas sp.]|uniref:thioredoxin domain-containing protein n=1 Tax=Terrimonas sp. TaxID=1914338 RepID=UPI000D512E0D|nr:thioredoxin domain-containing protein [Terrimonas sp.]PVD51612.1 thioredoxin domain-containing protein [Terrimonas sp.]
MDNYSNHLIHETSPYLLQHAHNPVDWYPWGETALQKALQEDKPILVSIGYSACHWCHVMEKESFEDEEIAAFMNDHFVNIKIDREERPDLDHIYMNAVQTMTGSGGWPLNVFLTPGKKPFYGGTYFPPSPVAGRPSWEQILVGVMKAFKEKRAEINNQAEDLTQHLLQSNSFGISPVSNGGKISHKDIDTMFENLMTNADTEWGGFGRAPKFPQTFSIAFCLRYYYYYKNETALRQALLSLDKMIYGGIYDQLGGGFARYSTDTEWLVPHFEKMLYDNALLIAVLCDAYQLTKHSLYKDIIDQTFGFVKRELMSKEWGFFSALDADSEGEEGKYYVWNKQEVNDLLGDAAALFCEYYDITEKGNWEGRNILNIPKPSEAFAPDKQINQAELSNILSGCGSVLLRERNKRTRPGLDDKILLGWNALMNTACSKAYAATGNTACKELAIKNLEFLLAKFSNGNGLRHTYKNGKSEVPAFIDDYAYLIQALIHLQEITGNQDYLRKAEEYAQYAVKHFMDVETGLFFYTHSNQEDVVIRIKEIYDGATASGNAIMAWNLQYLSLVFNNSQWKEIADKMTGAVADIVVKYPVSFGAWAGSITDSCNSINEIAIVGEQAEALKDCLLSYYMPNKVMQTSVNDDVAFPLLYKRWVENKTYIYLCRNYNCLRPVEHIEDLISQLGGK